MILSTVTKKILSNNVEVDHTFQLVDSTFPIPTDGILGRDFLTKFCRIINYDTWLSSGFFTIFCDKEIKYKDKKEKEKEIIN